MVIYGVILNLREIPLSEALKTKNIREIHNPSIVIDRNKYTLDLFIDTVKVKSYHVVFGRRNSTVKLSKNDFVTPIGEYRICRIDTNNLYYKKMMLNYPNLNDAAEALRLKLISQKEYSLVKNSLNNSGCSFENTILGNDIGIQGTGEYNLIFKNLPFVFNWTNGSIALSNENIDELLNIVKVGTKVTIKK